MCVCIIHCRILQRAHRKKIVDINCVDSLGRGALTIAIDAEHLEMVELLVILSVETKDALLQAINAEFVEAVELLLEVGSVCFLFHACLFFVWCVFFFFFFFNFYHVHYFFTQCLLLFKSHRILHSLKTKIIFLISSLILHHLSFFLSVLVWMYSNENCIL